MKAIVYRRYGSPDVLAYEEVDKPTAQDDEILIDVQAASANPLDWHFMRGVPYLLRLAAGPRRPKVPRLGVDVAGRVEAVGKDVKEFAPGDEVFGTCRGAFAEFVCASESAVVRKPTNLTWEQAAGIPVAACTALQALRDKGHVEPKQKVLINGAAGGVGTFAVQIAKSYGAVVTGVCSTRNLDLVRSIGADHAIDYTHEDFTRSADRQDLVVDCVGNRSWSACRRILNRRGTYVMVGGQGGQWIGPLAAWVTMVTLSPFITQTMLVSMTRRNKADLTTVRELVKDGHVTPVIDRHYGLRDVPDALRYLEEGHARGKVVITVD